MLTTGLVTSAGLVLAGFSIAGAALLAVAAMARSRDRSNESENVARFLFEGPDLVDMSDNARPMLATAPPRRDDLSRVIAMLSDRFPTLGAALDQPGDLRRVVQAPEDSGTVEIERQGTRLRVCATLDAVATGTQADPQCVSAMANELDVLRSVAEKTHVPVWRQSRDGGVVWANGAYLDLAERYSEEADAALWPPRALFDAKAVAEIETVASRRMLLEGAKGEAGHWFDCYADEVGDDLLVTAVPADPVIRAEEALRDFVNTLTGTFAHLSVGLAIFDRQRELALFNPALTDLLPLPVSFLSARPALFSFLDQLREQQLMPEPKDYKSWRQQMAALEAAAVDGCYSETWSLAGGKTYCVTGRPHPDGGVAFLFEDISAEISLTRRFRSELELGQSVLDALDEAVAVFSSGGVLILSNRAYAEIWSCDPSTGLGEITLTEATRHWHAMCLPTPVWGDARDFAASLGERASWTAEATMRDGRELLCRFDPLPGGATLASFSCRQRPATTPALPAPAQARA